MNQIINELKLAVMLWAVLLFTHGKPVSEAFLTICKNIYVYNRRRSAVS